MENGTKLNVGDVHVRSCDSYGVVTLGQGHGLLGAGAGFCNTELIMNALHGIEIYSKHLAAKHAVKNLIILSNLN